MSHLLNLVIIDLLRTFMEHHQKLNYTHRTLLIFCYLIMATFQQSKTA
jgi:hypothetical protein